MGEIIAFQSPATNKRAQRTATAEEAQILFFTGVRYVPAAQTANESDTSHHDGGVTPQGGRGRRAR
jgi:hypothetical protein